MLPVVAEAGATTFSSKLTANPEMMRKMVVVRVTFLLDEWGGFEQKRHTCDRWSRLIDVEVGLASHEETKFLSKDPSSGGAVNGLFA